MKNRKKPVKKWRLISRIFRVCFFQLGVYNFGYLEQFLIHRYRAYAFKRFRRSVPFFDRMTIDRSLQIMRAIGGEIAHVTPADKKTQVECMVLKAKNLRKNIEKRGGAWKKIWVLGKRGIYQKVRPNTEGAQCILAIWADRPTSKWNRYYREVLSQMYWRSATLQTEHGAKKILITNEHADLIQGETRCFLHCHSGGFSYPMERKRVGKHLGMEQDIALFDQRGHSKWIRTHGEPSEGAHRLDVEAVWNHLLKMGYAPTQIWVTGSCAGALLASHIMTKYHDLGVNFSGEGAFISLREDVIDTQIWAAKKLGRFALRSILSHDYDILKHTVQTGFDERAHWEKLTPYRGEKGGKAIFMTTATDKTIPPSITEKFYKIAKKKNPQSVYFLYHPKRVNGDGHSLEPLRDGAIFRKYMEAIFLPIGSTSKASASEEPEQMSA